MKQLVHLTILRLSSMNAWLALLCECGTYLSEVKFLPGLSNASLLSSEALLSGKGLYYSLPSALRDTSFSTTVSL